MLVDAVDNSTIIALKEERDKKNAGHSVLREGK